MKTLGVKQAAESLRMSVDALMRKARAGIVPGAKPGREWVFVEEDLRAYLAQLVKDRACRSISNLRAPTGGSVSRSGVSKLDAALAQPIVRRLKSSRPTSAPNFGGNTDLVSDRNTPGPRRSNAGMAKLKVVGKTETWSA